MPFTDSDSTEYFVLPTVTEYCRVVLLFSSVSARYTRVKTRDQKALQRQRVSVHE